MRTLRVGKASVSLINLGDLGFKLRDVENVSEDEWRQGYADVFENVHPYPSQSVFISLHGLSVLVDAGDYSKFAMPDSPYTIPGYKPPPNLIEQLAQIGVPREEVGYVVITHAHYDHYAGVTMETQEGFVPTFPDATYLLGKQDYENPETQKSLLDSNSEDSRTFGVLCKARKLELVEKYRKISDEIEILASPGETEGHKILRLRSDGDTLYCVGDLFHHACEVEHPSWMASWDEPKTNLQSRMELLDNALRENALLAPAHMPLGKVERTSSGFRYVEV
ncbi:MAG: MBL fold metallo-hydrolase [Nitrososphaerota archaeon]|nr:MBL fold metallo-hydrolase [Nitrososphaerota archaeon]